MVDKKIEELKAEISEEIESVQDFIKLANEKLEKYSCIFSAIYASCDEISDARGKLTELASAICKVSSLIDEAMVDIEDYKLQLERLEDLKGDKRPDAPRYIIIGLLKKIRGS